MTIEYAVYRGEDLLVIGTVEECATELNVKRSTIQWLATPTGQSRFEKRKKKERCLYVTRIEEDEE